MSAGSSSSSSSSSSKKTKKNPKPNLCLDGTTRGLLCNPDNKDWVVGKYIDNGVFGVVFEVCPREQILTCDKYVLKCIKYSDEYMISPVLNAEYRFTIEQFDNEVKLIDDCSRKDLCPKLIDSWKCTGDSREGSGVIIMDRMVTSVYKKVKKIKSDTDEVKKILNKAYALIHKLHLSDLIHGDPHLKNIMITKTGEYKFIDMGESKVLSSLKEKEKKEKIGLDYFNPLKSLHELKVEIDSKYLYDQIEEWTDKDLSILSNKIPTTDDNIIKDEHGTLWDVLMLDDNIFERGALHPDSGSLLSKVKTDGGENLLSVLKQKYD